MPVLFPFGSNFCVFCCSYAHWPFPVTGFCSTQAGVYEARRKTREFIVQGTVSSLGCHLHLTFQNFLCLFDIRSFICSQQENQGNVYSFLLPSEDYCPFNGRYVLRSRSNVKMVYTCRPVKMSVEPEDSEKSTKDQRRKS